jgi:hypothetical protein
MRATKLPDLPPAHLPTGHATDLHHDRLGCFTRWWPPFPGTCARGKNDRTMSSEGGTM